MAYLRQLVEECGLNAPTTKCKGCSRKIFKFEKFCPFCGRENVLYDLKVWKKFAKEPFKNYNCKKQLIHSMEALGDLQWSVRHPRMPKPEHCTQIGRAHV